VLDEVQFGFEVSSEATPLGDAFALIREAEGVTIVRPGKGWARITLGIHSGLDAVGLTAAVSAALARRGISANIVAGLHHDHVFVPWQRRGEAMRILSELAKG
jgi:hypothetical protein